MNKFLAPLFLVLSASAYATPFTITEPVVNEDCAKESEIRVVEENGEYYIKAFFDGSMNAIADGESKYQKRRCTLDFKISVAPNFQIDVFDFAVDGVYNLSENGVARLTVSHRVANAPSVRQTAFFSRGNGSPAAGDISNFVGSIFGYQLQNYGSCGASGIPLETSVYATATQPSGDQGLTQIDLDQGVSSTQGYTICKVKVKPCH
ncbi:MAG TPA: hypothetical protein VE954_06255 [Oligoflexus sp.]|uniref:hypothetical protein n=1 Tax=Oligoflexus sp. TaxID=1971216 RepID=UPI002D36657E|nr:hypothetical protein [Oligoflexus sp.]HYX32697.1 hypothetical protein [Oligoflexus sp.]